MYPSRRAKDARSPEDIEEGLSVRLLLVGKSSSSRHRMTGTIRVLEAVRSAALERGWECEVVPDPQNGKIASYAQVIGVLFRRWDAINVHLDANYGLVVGLLRFRSKIAYLTVHGYSKLESPFSHYLNFVQWLQIKVLFRHRIYPSQLMKQLIERKENIGGGFVIHNGFKMTEHVPEISDSTMGKTIDLFSLCGYGPNKGVGVLIHALSNLEAEYTAVVAGNFLEDYGVPNLDARVASKIRFLGNLSREDILGFLMRTRMYVQASLFESFSIPVLEAMSQGLPVIVSDMAGVSEVLTHNHDCLKVSAGDAKALSEAIELLLDDKALCKRLGGNARQTATCFTESRMAGAYLRYFDERRLSK